MTAHAPESNEAVYIWEGSFTAGIEFTAMYKVQVPIDAQLGTYIFSGSLEYRIEPHPAPSYQAQIGGTGVKIAVAAMIGMTREVSSSPLDEVAITLYQDGQAIESTVSDGSGNYILPIRGSGDYQVTANREGFRDENRFVTEPTYTLDFVGDYGLIPNAPDTSYVLQCISLWIFGEPPLQLSTSKVLNVISAWKYPI